MTKVYSVEIFFGDSESPVFRGREVFDVLADSKSRARTKAKKRAAMRQEPFYIGYIRYCCG